MQKSFVFSICVDLVIALAHTLIALAYPTSTEKLPRLITYCDECDTQPTLDWHSNEYAFNVYKSTRVSNWILWIMNGNATEL